MTEILVNIPRIEREYGYEVEARGIPLYVLAKKIRGNVSGKYFKVEGNISLFRKDVRKVKVWRPGIRLFGRVEKQREKLMPVFSLEGFLERVNIVSHYSPETADESKMCTSLEYDGGLKGFFDRLNHELFFNYHKRMRFEDFQAVFSQLYNHCDEWVQKAEREYENER